MNNTVRLFRHLNMNSLTEVKEALPKLSNEELRQIERVLRQLYRDRQVGVIFRDSYGTFTEDDLSCLQEEALRVIDGQPPKP